MTDDSLESVAAHGIRVRGPMGLVPRWSYAEPPEFGRLIADGAEDGRLWAARRARRAVEECSDALGRLSALESRAMKARRRMDDAVSRLDQSYDLDRLVPLSATRPPEVPALSCSADPAKAAARADRAAKGLSDWLKPVEATLEAEG